MAFKRSPVRSWSAPPRHKPPRFPEGQISAALVITALVLIAGASFLTACAGPSGRERAAGGPLRAAGTLIPNIDDDNGDGVPDSGAAPLAVGEDDDVLQVSVEPARRLPRGAVVRVEIAEPWTGLARAFIRVPSPEGPKFAKGPVSIDPKDVRNNGAVIGLEAADFAAPGRPRTIEWRVVFETRDGRPLDERRLTCDVAPFLLSSCLEPAERVQVVKTPLTEAFVRDLGPAVASAGAGLETIDDPSVPEHDIWIQDAMEIGCATDGARVMPVALHGNRGRELDAVFGRKFLGKNRGVIKKGAPRGDAAEWIDWYGNLEVSPPVRVNGREFGHGRAYAGTQGERAMHPEVVAFLEAQAAQAPLVWLDTSWLVIGHVDETVSWVPSKSGSPYRMMIPSPRLALEILRRAEKDSPGGILNRGTRRKGDGPGEFERPVAEALKDRRLLAAQELVQGKIDAVRRTLQLELGVADADIVEIPVLFNTSEKWYKGRYFAETVNMVNGLLLGDTYIVPDPRGPLVGGRDVLLQSVRERLEPLGCRVVPVDCFYPYHRWGGEIHCGTNAARRPARLSAPASK